MTHLNSIPEFARFLAARERAERALADQADCLARLKAFDAAPDRAAPTVRRPTLVGVAPQGRAGSAHLRASGVGCARPNGRY